MNSKHPTAGTGRALAVLALSTLLVACTEPFEIPGGEGLTLVVSGLSSPVLLTAPVGDDRLFIVEKSGRIRVFRDGTLLPTPFLDIASQTSGGGERGLLGLAFDPDYASNGTFYVNHTDNSGDTRILRFTTSADPNVADAASMQLVLEIDQPYDNHNGGHITFGPDGMLYVGMGDGGSGGDPDGHGQNRATLLGSMLRIDVGGSATYSVPSDNPFRGNSAVAPETWAYGLRNPWRFSFDRETGDLWIGDVGQNRMEEISFRDASSDGGENYGWNILEGTLCHATDPCDSSGTVLPIHEYDHDDGCSVTGGIVYRGTISTLRGRYFYADYCESWIRSFREDDGRAVEHFDHSVDFGAVPNITAFGEDGAGELYVVSINGDVYRVVEPDTGGPFG